MSDGLVVRRPVGRHLMMLVAAVLFVLAAYDVITAHVVSGPPERSEETGALTSTGLGQQRTDYLWGTLFLITAAGLTVVAVGALVARTPVVRLDHDALRLRVDGPNGFVEIPWSEVRWLHSGSDGDDDLVPTRVFLVHVDDPEPYPKRLWGAEWDGATLMVDAESWSLPPEEVVAHAKLAAAAWQRGERGGFDIGPPAPDAVSG